MLKNFTRLFLYLSLFTVFGVISAPDARADTGPIMVQPTAFYRFEISQEDGGYLLTHFFNEGAANGHPFVPFTQPTVNGLGIYRPPDGYTADPSTGLVRLHRWRVVQSGWRVYYYYSIYFTEHGSDYHYEGVAGWVFPPSEIATFNPFFGSVPLYQLSIWYSTELGFWYGHGEDPPNRPGKANYFPLGQIASLPLKCVDPHFQTSVGCAYGKQFNPPASAPPATSPPPSSCTSGAGAVSKCSQLGGSWNYETCSCEY